MPKRTDIKKILIIGSGPIIIGQACEFDYSGTQACKALRALGYEIVLVNSNPATIMTDPSTADVTYIEPLNAARLAEIIEKERPDALLPNLGGQSGLNLCSELGKAGIIDKFGVKVIGVQIDAIERGEDRIAFKNAMDELGIEMARSEPAYSVEQAEDIAERLGYPCVIRPAYTMGGAGGGFVHNADELRVIAGRGISASMVGQILVEESIAGWEELELEIVRDSKGHMITVCFIENIDPLGVHTGDSFCAAPMLTISEDTQKRLQEAAYKIVESIQVIGGTNVQFAHDPKTGRFVVIEINPRTSRSSALASKATGFPIALVSAQLAAGLTLDELPCGRHGTLDKYVPASDYVVIKFARWAFEKFRGSHDKLGTQMKAVGEVMSIGKTYKEAFQKAIRSLEIGRYGLGGVFPDETKENLLDMLKNPSSERHFIAYEALKKGAAVDEIVSITKIKRYFVEQMNELVETEKNLVAAGKSVDGELLVNAKKDGFSDRYIAGLTGLTGLTEEQIRGKRVGLGVNGAWDSIHVCGTEDAAYYYSTYCSVGRGDPDKPRETSKRDKVIILGGGPNRIGQGIEFDYCCVHAAFALRDLGFETIVVNCNPETVSTDYDTSDRLYFEPLTLEDVLSIYEEEKPLGVIAQFGGQTPLNLAFELERAGVNVLGTSPGAIDLAEDRDRFAKIMEDLGIPMPEAGMADNVDDALKVAEKIGYPLMVRPSYVLGGRGMEVVYDADALKRYMKAAIGVTPERPILLDRFLSNALECESDAISDGENVFVPAVMEHIELAGIHSGDSACVLPPVTIPDDTTETIIEYTQKIAKALNVVGLMNIQYAIESGRVYVLEANPRASRTVPLVSKVCSVNMVRIATEIITAAVTGRKSPVLELKRKKIPYFGVKECVLPFNMFPEVDPILGPEMRSTGEVLGIGISMGEAFRKAQEATGTRLPASGTVLLTVSDRDKREAIEIARMFVGLGFRLISTAGTHAALKANGIESVSVNKIHEGGHNIFDALVNNEVDLLINTQSGSMSAHDDSYIRKAAIRHNVPYVTTMAAARAAALGIGSPDGGVKALQEYHKDIM
ncbi:MAG: carbamoyl-phosphate synthase large subunit [Oscillospiraceae bacterium]|nr:carbamoyl-phosphate synthase large subunit [Oscillospiraceae bacterium]